VRTARDWWPCECLVDVVEVTSSVPSSSNSRHGQRLVGASDDAGSYPSHTWGQCASASADAECAALLTAKPCATEANELRLQVLLQQADDVYVQVTAVATGCNVSAHELAVTLVSSTWIVPAMKISLHQLPPSLVSSQSQKSLLSADAALFRARLRPSWLPLEADAYQVHAKLIINGVSAERLRRTSWRGVTRGEEVPLWPGPQTHADSMSWREEERLQKEAFHAHWRANARGEVTFPFRHAALEPVALTLSRVQSEPKQYMACTEEEGGLQVASSEGALHVQTRMWHPYHCDLRQQPSSITAGGDNVNRSAAEGSRSRKLLLVGDSVMFKYFKALRMAIANMNVDTGTLDCKQIFDARVQGADARYSEFLGSTRNAGEHWVCTEKSASAELTRYELWYHQLGRVDPPFPQRSAASAPDYYAKEQLQARRQHVKPQSTPTSAQHRSNNQNKDFNRYSRMDMLDLSYLYDTQLDAVLYNCAVHAYVLDPHVYAAMLDLILPTLELAKGGVANGFEMNSLDSGGDSGVSDALWYVSSGHVAGEKHPHNSKRYMHELQNNVRFGVFDGIARELSHERGWSVLEAYPMSIAAKNKDALHLDDAYANLVYQFLTHFVM
jgi:hypothetical protein